MSAEHWADVEGYEGSYQVSDHGRVRSVDRVDASGRRLRGRVLSPRVAKHGGRRTVALCADGEAKTAYVSRLVAAAFVPNPECLRSVRHLNGDQLDDRAENLEWCDQPTNAAEDWSKERSVPVTRGDGKTYASMTEAALDMGVAVFSVVQAVESGGTCLGYTFKRSSSDKSGGYDPDKRFWGNVVKRVNADGSKLKRLMTEMRVTVKDLSGRSGVSETKIWMIRSGSTKPTDVDLERIASALGVSKSEITL